MSYELWKLSDKKSEAKHALNIKRQTQNRKKLELGQDQMHYRWGRLWDSLWYSSSSEVAAWKIAEG